ncbi:hypothetical protein WL13_00040 [Burkholderia ubonensis]|nr:hypothetical protein WL13_00040 [Burkholderia ubonensis]
MFDGRQHHVAHDITAMTASRRSPTDGFPVVAVQRERHAQRCAIVTAELEAVRTPASVASINCNTSIMPTSIASSAGPSKQQLMVAHHTIDTLGIHAWCTGQLVATAQQRPDSPVAIGRQIRHHLVDFSEQPRVISTASTTTVLPVRQTSPFGCHRRARHTENIADRFHWSSPGQ